MSKEIGDKPAFPNSYYSDIGAISVRLYVATAALNGICANPDISAAASKEGLTSKEIRNAYIDAALKIAEALLSEEAKTREKSKD